MTIQIGQYVLIISLQGKRRLAHSEDGGLLVWANTKVPMSLQSRSLIKTLYAEDAYQLTAQQDSGHPENKAVAHKYPIGSGGLTR